MKEVGLFEAKTNLSKIAERVKRTGEAVTLTKRGEPYVDLVPHRNGAQGRRPQKRVLDELEKLRRELPKGGASRVKSDIAEGRR